MGADPITLIGAVATAVSAVGRVIQGQGQARAAEFNAQVSEQNAIAAEQAAREEEDRQRRDTRRRLGASRAAIGASGITIAGSPLDVMGDAAAELELEAQTIRFGGRREAQFQRNQARLDRLSAGQSRRIGFGSAAATIFGGAADYTRRRSLVDLEVS